MPDAAHSLTPLLPPNASPLARAAAEALAEIQRVPVPLRTLWHPATCPAPLLPYLAWAFSVDRWDPSWSEATRRRVIASAFYVHRKKGTLSAIRRVVEPLGYLIEIVEWFQTAPPGPRGTFDIRIGVQDQGITDEIYRELERLIDDARPLTRHIAGLDVAGETRGKIGIGMATHDGDVTTVYPYAPDFISSHGRIYLGAMLETFETTTLYPMSETP